MEDLLVKLSSCIERGKVDKNSAYPPDMKDMEGAFEITKKLLDSGVSPGDILDNALIRGMNTIGNKFGEGEAFLPELLIAAKAMNASMVHLKPFFESGEAEHKGTFIIGTVSGDLHDIGKNIVRMVLEGDGWKVVDLGKDVSSEKFLTALKKNPDSYIGISALLTTTMVNMESTVKMIKSDFPAVKVYIGGAPASDEYSSKIGADGYFPNPNNLVKHLSESI